MMIVFWVTLLVLHQGYSLVPVITVQLGEPVTFTCVIQGLSKKETIWYKQSAGDALELIVTLVENTSPVYEPGFSKRLEAKLEKDTSKLTILRTIREDEGMYHCGVTEYIKTEWSATYLLIKGNTLDYTVVQTVSDPVRPGDPVTLQCSVLSDSENKTCPGDPSVYWFRAGSEESHPNIIYTDGNDQCEQRSDTVKSCVHHFSKTISSSDAGTYYCAVATCGEILFGNGIKVDTEKEHNSEYITLVILVVCLTISVTGNIIFICCRTPQPVCAQFRGTESTSSQARHESSGDPDDDNTEAGHDLNYAAMYFSKTKPTRGRKKKEVKNEESVYAQVKY